MAWSKDNGACCDTYPSNPANEPGWHTHWHFKGPDASAIDDEQYLWCRDFNGGSC